jgi:hypothetical protein
MAALLPVITLLMFFGGIDPRWSCWPERASPRRRSPWPPWQRRLGRGAHGLAGHLVSGRAGDVVDLPAGPVVTLLPKLWPAAVPWVVPVAVHVLDSSPSGWG